MAATIIIYAGAIIVTFLFVIMLSQQTRQTDANDRSREPSLAAAVGFVLLGTLLVVLQRVYRTSEVDELIRQSDRYAQAESRGRQFEESRPRPIVIWPTLNAFATGSATTNDSATTGSRSRAMSAESNAAPRTPTRSGTWKMRLA